MNAAPSTNATTSRLTVVVSYGVLLLLIYLVFRIAEPFLKALAWAAVLVTFFYPMHKRLAKRLSATRASAISTFAVTILLIAPAILLTTLFVRQAVAISRGVQHSLVEQHAPLIAKGWSWLANRIPGMDANANIFETLEQGIEKQVGFLAERLGTILKNIAAFVFDLLPVLGSGLIFVPASLWLGFTGHWWRAIVLLAICAGISTIADNLLRPVLLGGRTELSGLVIFISVLGGVHLFGMLGLVLGPILVAMAAGVLSVYQESAEGPAITAG